MFRLRFVVLLSLVVFGAACSKSSEPAGPTAPSNNANAPAAGALVTGTVQATAAASGAALTVQVTGTNLTAAVSPVGQFSIANVPAGPVELRFSAPGVDAKVTVGTVAAGDTLNVIVQVSGSSAVVRSEDRNNGSGEQRITGAVARLTGTASAFTFFIGTREVRGASSTQFTGQGSSSQGFTNLRNGATVEVRGSMTGEVLNAIRVHFEDDNGADDDEDEDEDEFVGRITSITGTQPNLTLIVSGRTVRTSSSTIVRRRGNVVGLGFLALQQEVEVEGRGAAATTGTIEASKITVEDEADDDDDDEGEVEVTGNVSGLSSVASCPSVSFTVAGTSFTTNASTEFRSACSGLRNGDRVEVKGRRTSATGPVTATRVKRE